MGRTKLYPAPDTPDTPDSLIARMIDDAGRRRMPWIVSTDQELTLRVVDLCQSSGRPVIIENRPAKQEQEQEPEIVDKY